MSSKTNLNSELVLKKKFKTELSGYSPEEVDKYLDQILEDYVHYEQLKRAQEKNLDDKNQIIRDRDSQIETLKLEIQNLKEQLEESSKATNFGLQKELREIKKHILGKKG